MQCVGSKTQFDNLEMGRLSFKVLACCFGKEVSEDHSLKADPVTETCEGLEKSKTDPVLRIRVVEDSQTSYEISLSASELPATFGSGPDASFHLHNSGDVLFRFEYNEDTGRFEVQREAGAGPFLKVTDGVEVGDEIGVSFGYDNFMRVALVTGSLLKVQFIEGEKAGLTHTFRPRDSPVQLGRMKDCKLKFDDTGLSRYQCLLTSETGEWRLRDGDGRRESTNGTWVLLRGRRALSARSLLKAGGVLLEVTADSSNM